MMISLFVKRIWREPEVVMVVGGDLSGPELARLLKAVREFDAYLSVNADGCRTMRSASVLARSSPPRLSTQACSLERCLIQQWSRVPRQLGIGSPVLQS
jgi:hypothetical protein